MKLTVDMTPTTLNRTAIFHIALDTARALSAVASSFRYGKEYVSAPIRDIRKLDEMRDGILAHIFGDCGLIQEVRGLRKIKGYSRARRAPILHFDPLYVLFDEVNAEDFVLVLDLTPVTNPEWHHPRVSELYKIAFRRIAVSGMKVASISLVTARALWANYGIPTDSTVTIPLYLRDGVGPAANEVVREGEATTKSLLFVGSLETRKNLPGLFRAFEASGLAQQDYKLVVAGSGGSGSEAIKEDAAHFSGVELRGFVPDSELRALYRRATAFVYPSYYEGFGLPILEASSWGLPILTSKTGATMEVAPPGSFIVDPYNIGDMATALCKIVSLSQAERWKIQATSHKHAARFRFEQYMKTMLDFLRLDVSWPIGANRQPTPQS